METNHIRISIIIVSAKRPTYISCSHYVIEPHRHNIFGLKHYRYVCFRFFSVFNVSFPAVVYLNVFNSLKGSFMWKWRCNVEIVAV